MGVILKGKCTGCGYETDLPVGGGLMDRMPKTAASLVGKSRALSEALSKGADFQIQRMVALCPRCRELRVGAIVTWITEDGHARWMHRACPDCNGVLRYYSSDAKTVPCPACERTASLSFAGYWD